MRRGLCAAVSAGFAVATILVLSGATGAEGAAAPGAVACASGGISVSVVAGVPAMGRANLVVLVTNDERGACSVAGRPAVRFHGGSGGRIVGAATPSPPGEPTRPLVLGAGETASALLSGSDRPLGAATSCPSFAAYTVLATRSGPAKTLRGVPLLDCAGLTISAFVPGYNGTSPSGEVSGRAPRCALSAVASASGAFVEVDAWSGRRLAGAVGVAASADTVRPYTLVLPPGRYRVVAHDGAFRLVTVGAGRTTVIGLFGVCAQPPATLTTIPPRASVTPTTSVSAPKDVLTDIAFFNPRSGYGLFTRQGEGQAGCQALVGSTTDGGAVFGSLTVVTSWSCARAAPVSKMAFDDHGDGFLYDPELFVTHDAGRTWGQVPQSGVVLSVEALGSSVWTVESSCPAPTDLSHPCSMRLLESEDGGRTWDAVGVPAGATTDGLGAQTWLVRLSASAAYLASSPSFNYGAAPSTAPLWYTADGGRAWSARQVDCGVHALTDAVSAAPDGTLVAVCADQPSAGSQPKSTVRSTDGGFSWTTMTRCAVATSSINGCAVPSSLWAGYLGGIDAVSDDTVYLVGGRSSLLATHDGGATWAAVQPLIGDTSDGTANVIFFSGTDGVVLGDDGQNDDVATIWSTSDGGATWHSVVPVE